MNYETAKAKFERIVQRMQADLQEYAAKKTASPAAIEVRLQTINDLVDYYNITNELVSEEQMKAVEFQLAYTSVWNDARRLVLFAQLHGINPNMIYYYNYAELEELSKIGIHFCPPKLPWSRLKVTFHPDGSSEITEIEMTDDECDIVRPHEEKYFKVKLLADRPCKRPDALYYQLTSALEYAKQA